MTSESVKRVSQASQSSESYGRTDGRTNAEVQDLGDSLTSHIAHENGGIDPEVAPVGTALHAVTDQLEHAYDRMPVVRTGRPGRIDPQIRRAVLMRDHFTCRWCHHSVDSPRDKFEIDHIVPWSAGGTNATDNLRTLCKRCNQSRSNRRSDADTARALLIVGWCPWCKGRHYVHWYESPDGVSRYVYDEDALTEFADGDREVPVWCLECRAPSATSRAHADDVRRRQAERYAQPAGDGETTEGEIDE